MEKKTMTRDNRQSQVPDEARIAALLEHIRPTPGQRFYEQMAAMPWYTSHLSEREQIMRLSRLLRISTVAAAVFALLWVSVSVFALSQRTDTPEPPILISRGNVAMALSAQYFTAFPDLRVGDVTYFLVPEFDPVVANWLNRMLGDTVVRPRADVLKATLIRMGEEFMMGEDVFMFEMLPSDAEVLVGMDNTGTLLGPDLVIPSAAIPQGYTAVPVALEGDVPFQVGDRVQVWADTITSTVVCPECKSGDTMSAQPEDFVVCQNRLAEDVTIIAIDSRSFVAYGASTHNVEWGFEIPLTVVTVAVPVSMTGSFELSEKVAWPTMRLEAWDAPENDTMPYCEAIVRRTIEPLER
jgi:hypothetical protein